MPKMFRRVFLLWLFMFWQGGFLFYGTVVVTIGAEVQGSDFAQGLITRRVAVAINLTGVAVLLAWMGDLIAERESRLRRRWCAWLFLCATLGVLFWIHPQMDVLIDIEHRKLIDGAYFHRLHRWYLRATTLQGIASVVFTVWTLQNWRDTDRKAGNSHAS